jgi:hypothetical protein
MNKQIEQIDKIIAFIATTKGKLISGLIPAVSSLFGAYISTGRVSYTYILFFVTFFLMGVFGAPIYFRHMKQKAENAASKK